MRKKRNKKGGGGRCLEPEARQTQKAVKVRYRRKKGKKPQGKW